MATTTTLETELWLKVTLAALFGTWNTSQYFPFEVEHIPGIQMRPYCWCQLSLSTEVHCVHFIDFRKWIRLFVADYILKLIQLAIPTYMELNYDDYCSKEV